MCWVLFISCYRTKALAAETGADADAASSNGRDASDALDEDTDGEIHSETENESQVSPVRPASGKSSTRSPSTLSQGTPVRNSSPTEQKRSTECESSRDMSASVPSKRHSPPAEKPQVDIAVHKAARAVKRAGKSDTSHADSQRSRDEGRHSESASSYSRRIDDRESHRERESLEPRSRQAGASDHRRGTSGQVDNRPDDKRMGSPPKCKPVGGRKISLVPNETIGSARLQSRVQEADKDVASRRDGYSPRRLQQSSNRHREDQASRTPSPAPSRSSVSHSSRDSERNRLHRSDDPGKRHEVAGMRPERTERPYSSKDRKVAVETGDRSSRRVSDMAATSSSKTPGRHTSDRRNDRSQDRSVGHLMYIIVF